jgi:hypothetical protein
MLFVLGGLLCCPALAEEPRQITVPRLEGEIRVDGYLDETAWTHAAKYDGFLLNESEKKPRVKTTVFIGYTPTNLYLGWRCDDPDIQATFTKRDDPLWEEEVAELFLFPRENIPWPGPVRYFELQWNPLGTMFDAVIHNTLGEDGWSQKMQGDWEWTAEGMQSAVAVDGTVQESGDTDQGWTVEAVIPFADFGVNAPKPGTIWRGNFYRYNRDTDKSNELLSLHPTTKPSFHEPKRFMKIKFVK